MTGTGHGAWDVVLSADHAFVSANTASTWYKVPKAGGATDQQSPSALGLDGQAIWASTVYVAASNATDIFQSPVSGAFSSTVFHAGSYFIQSVTADSTGVYWEECGASRIRRANHDGTGVVNAAINVDCPERLIVDATSIYFTTTVLGAVYKIPKGVDVDASAIAPWVSAGVMTYAITQNATHVYFATFDVPPSPSGKSDLYRVSKTGSPSLELMAANQTVIFGIAVDATHVYFVARGTDATSYTDGTVSRVALATPQAVEVLATNQARPLGIALDTAAVYWTNGGSTPSGAGALMRLAK
jgi:hypothetical protein